MTTNPLQNLQTQPILSNASTIFMQRLDKICNSNIKTSVNFILSKLKAPASMTLQELDQLFGQLVQFINE